MRTPRRGTRRGGRAAASSTSTSDAAADSQKEDSVVDSTEKDDSLKEEVEEMEAEEETSKVANGNEEDEKPADEMQTVAAENTDDAYDISAEVATDDDDQIDDYDQIDDDDVVVLDDSEAPAQGTAAEAKVKFESLESSNERETRNAADLNLGTLGILLQARETEVESPFTTDEKPKFQHPLAIGGVQWADFPFKLLPDIAPLTIEEWITEAKVEVRNRSVVISCLSVADFSLPQIKASMSIAKLTHSHLVNDEEIVADEQVRYGRPSK